MAFHKCLISFITIALSVSGLSLLTIGTLLIVMSAKYGEFFGFSFFVLPIYVIVTAAGVLCTAALGWYAVRANKYNLFSAYLAILVALLIFEIAISILGFQLEDDIFQDKIINHNMYDCQKKFNQGWDDLQMATQDQNLTDYQIFNFKVEYYNRHLKLKNCDVDWNVLQKEFNCCGYNNKYDYEPDNIPLSCCPLPWRGQSPFQCTSSQATYTGCRASLNWMLASYAVALGITASTVTCAQGIIILLAGSIAYKMKKQRETSYKELPTRTDNSQYDSILEQSTQ